MVLQWPTDGADGGDDVDEFLVVDLAGGQFLARLPDRGAGAGALALPPAVQHRPAGQHDRRNVHGRRRHEAGRRGLVAAGRQHDAVERIAVQHLDQAEIGEVAVERRGRPLAGFLDRMHRELEGDAAGVADALAHALGELEVMAVARRQIRAGLRDADDRLAGAQLLAGQAVVEIALEIERGHARVVGIVEPQLRAQRMCFCRIARSFAHFPSPWACFFLPARMRRTARPRQGRRRIEMAGTSPAITESCGVRCRCRAPRVALRLAADRGRIGDADISFQQLLVGFQRRAVALIDDAAALDDDRPVGDAQNLLRVLLDQDRRQAFVADDPAQARPAIPRR